MSHSPSASSDGPIETHQGVCNLCEAICGLTFQVQGERIVSIKGNDADPFSRGHICPKAVALKDVHEDPDRLRRPVRRVGQGADAQWVEISWDQAFDLVACKLVEVRQQHGNNAVGIYQGNPTVHNWGNITHGPLFMGQLKTRNRFSATSVDQLPHHLTSYWLYGHQFLLPIPDIDRTQYMIMLGGNPLASNGSIMTVPDVRKRLKALQARGGKLVVIDPRRTETAAIADEHLAIKPSGDAAFLLAMVHVLLNESLAKPRHLQGLIKGLDELKQAVAAFTPEATAATSGIDADTTRRLTRELAQAESGVCYGRMGVSTQVNGVVCQWAIQVINILTGNLDKEGGTLVTHPAIDLVKTGLIGPGHVGAWRSRVRKAPEFGGELPVSVLAEEILTPGPGQIRAMVTSCGNPVLSTPNGQQLDQALSQLDFMVSVDFYINETTRHADVILPPTCFVEHDHYDLIFMHFAVRNVARYSPAILPKPDGALHDWEIYAGLAKRYAQHAWALERGGTMQRLKGMLTRSAMSRLRPDQLLTLGLRKGAYPLRMKQLRAAPQGIDLGPLRPGLSQSLAKKGRHIALLPKAIADELPQLANRMCNDRADPSALTLIGRRDVRSNNSWMHNSERLVSGKARCVLWMHTDDAAQRGLSEGQTVQITSRVGQVDAPVFITPDIRPGVVSLPHGWGHGRQGVKLGVASQHAGVSLNDLTDDQLTDQISGNAALNSLRVHVKAA
ncbi:molybdopterin-dependent oxidoreductase [Aquabacterium sp. CECT 9606]|uniref:molybdopterin-dependent oxidoreductase n=1 Tax=Aquabacterium sp. CECT 9606 TaxID=2845822 RepID=UPI001E2D9E5E|nr:molybdopterin-dependent oxidoreductase [Aquabacterium sp. CECT 9606]CAH0351700.1 Polysulfide reductase chain A [Aquabacterium sp. CECT 9606]